MRERPDLLDVMDETFINNFVAKLICHMENCSSTIQMYKSASIIIKLHTAHYINNHNHNHNFVSNQIKNDKLEN